VRANYNKLEDYSWVTVDADGTMDEVHKELYQIITAEVRSFIQLLPVSYLAEKCGLNIRTGMLQCF
jgi:hypothetical protein